MEIKKVGVFSKEVIELLGLSIAAGTPIFIGERNERHIAERHPVEFELYYHRLGEIISSPDYVIKNESNQSIDYVKVFRNGDDYIQASVRVSANGKHYVRTLFQIMSYKVERYIKSGKMKKLP